MTAASEQQSSSLARAPSLAPSPDFRHVSLVAYARAPLPWALAGMGIATALGIGPTFGWGEAACVGFVGVSTLAVSALRSRRSSAGPSSSASASIARGRAVAMSIVPWGVIVEEGSQTRVLRWGAIERVDVVTLYGRDQASDVTKGSLVVIDTRQERLFGRAPDAVSLERLLAHRESYAREAAHVAAIDLEGACAAGESWEPQVEQLLLTCGEMLRGGGGALPSSPAASLGYRGRRTSLPAEDVAVRLRTILRDRTDRAFDPRPLGAILAAELRLTALAPDVAELVTSPHALTAATARVAAMALGLPKSRVGVLEEVAPFLPEADVEALGEWTEATLTLTDDAR